MQYINLALMYIQLRHGNIDIRYLMKHGITVEISERIICDNYIITNQFSNINIQKKHLEVLDLSK